MRLSASSSPIVARRRGFTLLELIVVLVVLGLLAAIAIPTYQAIVNGAETSAETSEIEAVARAATAVAALDGSGVPTVEQVRDVLLETSAAGVPGVEASYPAGAYVLYVQGEWSARFEYPSHPGKKVMVYGTNATSAGLASLSESDPTVCVMVRFGRGSTESHTAPVGSPLDCDANLALAGPGNGTEAPPAEEPSDEVRHAMVNMMSTTGSLDDVRVTSGSTVIVDDNFNRADGTLLPVESAPWTFLASFGFPMPEPVISNGRLFGPSDEQPAIAFVEVPNAAFRIEATVASLPEVGGMQIQAGNLAEFAASHLFGIEADGRVMPTGRVGDCENNDAFRGQYIDQRVQVGDRITLLRDSDNVARFAINGAVVATVDRADLSAATHGCDPY